MRLSRLFGRRRARAQQRADNAAALSHRDHSIPLYDIPLYDAQVVGYPQRVRAQTAQTAQTVQQSAEQRAARTGGTR